MPDVSFSNLLIVMVIAVLAPPLLGYAPGLRIPSVVLEIIAGVVVGPSVLGWVQVDLPVQILALIRVWRDPATKAVCNGSESVACNVAPL